MTRVQITHAEIVRAWHAGWTFREEMNCDHAEAIARCPYKSGRLRREWIGGWNEAEAVEMSREEAK